MAHLDSKGRVWVTTDDADRLYKAAKLALREFDNLHGADLFAGDYEGDTAEGFKPLVRAMHQVRGVLGRIEKL